MNKECMFPQRSIKATHQHDFNSPQSLKVSRPVPTLSWNMWDKFVAFRDTLPGKKHDIETFNELNFVFIGIAITSEPHFEPQFCMHIYNQCTT